MKSLLFLSLFSFGKTNRISQVYVDLGKPIPLYLSIGRSTLIDFPCSIISATPGPGKDVEITAAKTNPKELHLFLRSSQSQSTNMIVRCEDAVFIFDIIPSKTNHQDYFSIDGYYGTPEYIETNTQKVETNKEFSRDDLYSVLKKKETPELLVYNEDFGQGKIIYLNQYIIFIPTSFILKYGKKKETQFETSKIYGKGVWVKSNLTNSNDLFISGLKLEEFMKESQL